MEIHPHEAHNRPRFYEFLMLFLAVTASFFVENIREYYIERHREKQFIESFILDLQTDTMQINKIIATNIIQMKGIDTVLTLFEKQDDKLMVNKLYIYTLTYLSSCEKMLPSDRTISQLKNSGGMRLIRNSSVSDSIMDYSQNNENIKDYNDFLYKFFYELINTQDKILDFKVFRKIGLQQIKTDPKIQILKSETTLNDYYNQILRFGSTIQSYNATLIQMRNKATVIMKFMEETYHLKKKNNKD
jgi:hypothetical protein